MHQWLQLSLNAHLPGYCLKHECATTAHVWPLPEAQPFQIKTEGMGNTAEKTKPSGLSLLWDFCPSKNLTAGILDYVTSDLLHPSLDEQSRRIHTACTCRWLLWSTGETPKLPNTWNQIESMKSMAPSVRFTVLHTNTDVLQKQLKMSLLHTITAVCVICSPTKADSYYSSTYTHINTSCKMLC